MADMGNILDTNAARGDGAVKLPERLTFANGTAITSMNSRFRLNLVLHNSTPGLVSVHWLDFKGKEVPYGKIPAGSAVLLYSYLTHPWTFRDERGNAEGLCANGKPVLFPRLGAPDVYITLTPFLSWSLANHTTDFKERAPAFHSAVKALLLSHHVLHKVASTHSTYGGDGSYAGGRSKSRRNSSGDAPAAVATAATAMAATAGAGACGPILGMITRAAARMMSSSGAACPAPRVPSSSNRNTSGGGSSTSSFTAMPCGPTLGQLPHDVLLLIVAKMAPSLYVRKPMDPSEVQLFPEQVEPANGPIAWRAAYLLGPMLTPAPPFAAAGPEPLADEPAEPGQPLPVEDIGGGEASDEDDDNIFDDGDVEGEEGEVDGGEEELEGEAAPVDPAEALADAALQYAAAVLQQQQEQAQVLYEQLYQNNQPQPGQAGNGAAANAQVVANAVVPPPL